MFTEILFEALINYSQLIQNQGLNVFVEHIVRYFGKLLYYLRCLNRCINAHLLYITVPDDAVLYYKPNLS